MVKLYFVCMGNYYRSRLAEELARHYAATHEVQITADSGGLSVNAGNVGPMSRLTINYLAQKGLQPLGGDRYPKSCTVEDVEQADVVVCTDENEQLALFKEQFPNYTGKLIVWGAPDFHNDPFISTPDRINYFIEELIKDLKV